MRRSPDALGLERFFRKPVTCLYANVGQVFEKLLAELAFRDLVHQAVYTATFSRLHIVCYLDKAPDRIDLGRDLGIIVAEIVKVLAYVLAGTAHLERIEYDGRCAYIT